MNKLIITARPTKDPEIRYSQGTNSTAVAKFDVAVNRKFKREGEADADFFSCVAFGKQAEAIEKYVRKGTKILIEGEVRNNNYTNRDGQKVYGTQIFVESFEFCESKQNADGNNNAPAPSSDGFMQIPDGLEGDLPF